MKWGSRAWVVLLAGVSFPAIAQSGLSPTLPCNNLFSAPADRQTCESANRGTLPAIVATGVLLSAPGSSESQNVEASRLFRLAAERGDAEGGYRLALQYQRGRGVSQDDREAARLLNEAASRQHAGARNALAMAFEDALGVPHDLRRAAALYEEAARQGLADAQYNLGRLYQNGTGVTRDTARAVQLFRQAAAQGNPTALNQLGVLLSEGRIVVRDDAEAARNFRRAADQGHAAAQFNLAQAFEAGRGVRLNLEEARLWYVRASDQGLPQAREALERIRQGPTIAQPENTPPSPAARVSPGGTQSNLANPPGAVPPPPAATVDREALFWQSIQASTNAADFEAYLAQFPVGTFAALARNRIAALRAPAAAPAAPVQPQVAAVPPRSLSE